MKKLQNRFLIAVVLLISNAVLAQDTLPLDFGNYNCGDAFCLSDKASTFSFTLEEGQHLYYRFHWNFSPYQGLNQPYCNRLVFGIAGIDLNEGSYELFGPFSNAHQSICDQINNYSNSEYISNSFAPQSWTATYSEFQLSNNTVFQNGLSSGYFILKINPGVLTGQISYQGAYSPDCFSCQPAKTIPCEDCVTSFMPTKGKYMVSAWVKEVHTGDQPVSYGNSELLISFTGSSVTFSLTPSGQIIDGWQRIEAEIEIPPDATEIHIDFVATGTLENPSVPCFFDDIRFFPYDGSMMSYVYDPRTLRLMAQLDDRNYATLYEYDEEGKLIRVKKETERGIMTIQENRNNIVKKP